MDFHLTCSDGKKMQIFIHREYKSSFLHNQKKMPILYSKETIKTR